MSEDDGSLSEEAALELVADETRARILKALGDATVERDGLPRLSYTELREAAGIRDSGRFNYHLKKLEGRWVTKHDDGYKLPMRGQHVYSALVSGSFTADAAPDPFVLADRCPYCAHRLTGRYTRTDVRLLVVCEHCGFGALNVYFPPNSLSTYDDRAALVDAAVRHSRMETGQMARGQCFSCAGPVRAALVERAVDEGLPWATDRRPASVYATMHCESCTSFHYTTVGELVSYHPVVVGFCADRGLNVSATRKWHLEWIVTNRYASVESTDPWRVVVDVPVPSPESDRAATDWVAPGVDLRERDDVAVLRTTVDGDGAVVATEEL